MQTCRSVSFCKRLLTFPCIFSDFSPNFSAPAMYNFAATRSFYTAPSASGLLTSCIKEPSILFKNLGVAAYF